MDERLAPLCYVTKPGPSELGGEYAEVGLRGKRLRLAITADPEIAVPPTLYGGIERIIDMLVRGLVSRGHDVTLFAHPDSVVPCPVVAYPWTTFKSRTGTLRNTLLVSTNILRGRFDIVHSFGRLAYMMPILPISGPKIMSYQREVTERSVIWGTRLSRGTLHFTGCSRHLVQQFLGNSNCHVVYNGVPADTYKLRESVSVDAPLVFLGRVEEIKGPHLAVEIARRSGRSLVIAGNIPEGEAHQAFFKTHVAPYVNGEQVRYVGPVNDAEKNELLGKAAAFLMPILWEEPFGIVMAEALACGTPVIGLNRGSVPEIVKHGVNGFVCGSIDEMIAAVGRLNEIDRAACRRIMEEKFSDMAVVDAYENLYFKLLGTAHPYA
ncbi:MAG TPA: glycosyltransferase family 4 protein [Pyrinomonadaceae bacterium]